MIDWNWNNAPRRAWALLLVAAIAMVSGAAAATPSVRAEPAPSWRTPIRAEDSALGEPPSGTTSNGSRYLLLDRQTRVREGALESYTHVVRKISNEAGLQALSQLSIDFDATYQTLAVHAIVVHRDGAILDRLVLSAINLVQREPMLEAQVYDGRQSAVLFLNDLRVGDSVEYAYTLRGSDPTLNGHYTDGVLLGAPEPVDRLYASLLVPRARQLSTTLHGPWLDAAEPVIEERGELLKYTWDFRDVPARVLEEGAPEWYEPLPWSQVSDFESWTQVATWGARLFQVNAPHTGPLRDWVDSARRESASPDDFGLKAVRFVQDEVRYVAIEVGLARRRPTDPATVFARRYGDCKDKAALLVTMLKMGGIQAIPALVSTTHGHTLLTWRPSPSAFDHAIVRVNAGNGAVYWLDPTASLQGGAFGHEAFAPYEWALPLEESATRLEALVPPSTEHASRLVRDHFDVPLPGSSDEARLDSDRTYESAGADMMRATFRSHTKEQTAKEFLRLYQEDFPAIHEVAPLELFDDRESNTVRVVTHFAFPAFWTLDAKDLKLKAEHVARAMERVLPRQPMANRVAPIGLAYPFHMQHVMEFKLPFDLPAKPDKLVVETPALRFQFTSSCIAQRHLSYTYDLVTRSPAISAKELTSHAADLGKARQSLGRSLTYRAPLPDGFNWVALFAVLGCAPFLFWGMFRAYRYEPKARSTTDDAPGPEGLGGWLILLGFNLVGTLLVRAGHLVRECRSVFSLASWNGLTTPELPTYNPTLAVVAIAELIVMAGCMAYGVMVAALFFRKGRSFPFHFPIYAIGAVVFHLVDQGVVSLVVPERTTAFPSQEIASSIVATMLWCLYVANSKRVRATFVRPARRNATTATPPSEDDFLVDGG